ncbi:MAG: hypothetical protein ABIK68_23520 [bacterium]
MIKKIFLENIGKIPDLALSAFFPDCKAWNLLLQIAMGLLLTLTHPSLCPTEHGGLVENITWQSGQSVWYGPVSDD